jgi:hypothetical protein
MAKARWVRDYPCLPVKSKAILRVSSPNIARYPRSYCTIGCTDSLSLWFWHFGWIASNPDRPYTPELDTPVLGRAALRVLDVLYRPVQNPPFPVQARRAPASSSAISARFGRRAHVRRRPAGLRRLRLRQSAPAREALPPRPTVRHQPLPPSLPGCNSPSPRPALRPAPSHTLLTA